MNNNLTYILTLNDRMSATLQKVGINTHQTTKEVDKLDKSVNGLNKVNLSGFLSSIGKISAALGVGAAIGKTVKMGMEQEMRNTSFEVLFGGTDNAKKMIDEISGYAAKSPYGKVGLSEATQMMAGFGIAQDKIMPNLRAIGDIAMGDEQKFRQLSLAFSQMSSAGKLTGQDLLQMIGASFNPLNELEKMTGKTQGQLRDMMSKGLISSKMVEQAFHNATSAGGLYHGMIDRINNTVGGQWATAMDNMTEKLLHLYFNVLQPLLLPALKMFNEFLDDPIGTIKSLYNRITTDFPVITGVIITATAAVVAYRTAMFTIAGLHAIVAAWKSVLVAYEIVVFAVRNSTNLWTAAQWLLNMALTANPIGLIIAAIAALIALITFLIMKIDGWGKMWKHTVKGAELIFKAHVAAVKYEFNTMINALTIGLNLIKTGWYEFQEAVGLGDSSANQKMLAQIRADTEARKNAIAAGYTEAKELGLQAVQEFKAAAGSLSWGKASVSDIANGLKNDIGISTANVPGTTPGNQSGTTPGGTGGLGKETANGIATGGTKTTHITINLGQLVESIHINKNGFRESAENMRDIVLDELTRTLSMAQGQV